MASTKQRYLELATLREPFLIRARIFAGMTLPSLLPPNGFNYTQDLPTPDLNIASDAVLHLASKLMTAHMPAGNSLFRLEVTPEALVKSGKETADTDVQRKLSLIEGIVESEVARRAWRPKLFLVEQHLIVTGNVLMVLQPDNTLRLFRLDQYVVTRDHQGNPTEIIIEERLPSSPSEAVLAIVGDAGTAANRQKECLYTCITRDADKWTVHQEIKEQIVPGSSGEYALGALPYYPLRWSEIVGEDYGRSKVEEHEATFRYGGHLSICTGDGAAIAARALIFVKPTAGGGLNLRRRIRDARSGDVVVGNPDDVDFKSFQSVAGFQFAAAELAQIKRELSAAFLMNSAARRDAERVTMYEVRAIVEELEGTLGGVYSLQSNELMLPLIVRLMLQMAQQKRLPQLPQDVVAPIILTGQAALGREADFQRVGQAMQLVAGAPPGAAAYVNWSEMLKKGMIGAGLADCVYTEAEVQQMQQQAQMMNALTAAAPNIAKPAAEAAFAPPQQTPTGP